MRPGENRNGIAVVRIHILQLGLKLTKPCRLKKIYLTYSSNLYVIQHAIHQTPVQLRNFN